MYYSNAEYRINGGYQLIGDVQEKQKSFTSSSERSESTTPSTSRRGDD